MQLVDAKRQLRLTDACADVESWPDLQTNLLPTIGAAMASSAVIMHIAVNVFTGEQFDIGWPDGVFSLDVLMPYPLYAASHPIITYHAAGGTESVIAISDLTSDRQWRSTPMYTDVLSELGADDQISLRIPGPNFLRGITCCRPGRRFSDAEKDGLRALLPHMRHAINRAVRNARRGPESPLLVRMTPSVEVTTLEQVDRQLVRGHSDLALTAKQVEVLGLLARGRSTQQIARSLGISPRTVSKHCEAIYTTLAVSGRYEASERYLRAVESL